MIKKNIVEIGEFDIKSGDIVVTDPCYELAFGQCMSNKIKGKIGSWAGIVKMSDEGDFGMRVSGLWAIHKDYVDEFDDYLEDYLQGPNFRRSEWSDLICVDSGQAGIFDCKEYPGGDGEDPDPDDFEWFDDDEKEEATTHYHMACKATSNEKQAGIVGGYGVVSSTGFGDGGYDLCVFYDGDEAVACYVEYISDEEHEEYEICDGCGEELEHCNCD